ncbi:hypothetical protein EJ07DRAFT_156713 [Lizonia empirigonia]|nr:hypothetical protein EJ07DRAFT_156713 [Lizonia empirigonia]
MAQASASTCKAAGSDTLSIVTTEYSKNRTSEQWSQHHAQAEEDKDLSCCFGWFPSFTSLFPTTAPKKRPDRFNRLSWQCAGHTKPVVVNNPTNKLNQNTHLHTCASCEESSSGSCPHRANTFQCPGLATDVEKTDLYIKNSRHDSSIDSDTQGLSLTPLALATETARIWDIYERRALLHHKQILMEDTLSLIRKSAGQASTASVPLHRSVDDSQLASSAEQPFLDLDNRIFESKCESGQTFNIKDGCIVVTTEIFVDTTESRNTLVAALLAFRRILAQTRTRK